jgi:hypothetical protein
MQIVFVFNVEDYIKMDPLSIIYKLPESLYDRCENEEQRSYKFKTEGTSNIVAAYFIKSVQENKNKKVENLQNVNDATNNQLNVVNDIMKKINEQKMNEIIEKDYSNN